MQLFYLVIMSILSVYLLSKNLESFSGNDFFLLNFKTL